jgi:MFS family permease
MKNEGGRWSPVASVLITFLSGFSMQISGIFLPIYATDIGASKLEIGFIGGAFGVSYLLSSIFSGRLSDIKGRVVFIRLGFGLAAVSYAAQLLAVTPLLLIIERATLGFCIAMCDSTVMALNFEVGGRTSRFTSLGALGWLAGGILTIFLHNYRALFVTSALGCGAAFLIAWTLEEPKNRKSVRPEIITMLRRNYKVYIPFFLRNVGVNMIWFIFPVYLVNLGATKSWIAILQCTNTGLQFFIMMFIDRFSARRLFVFGIFSSVVVFASYALARDYLQMIPVQALMALSWSCLYLGSLMTLFKTNDERATCVAMLFSMSSLSGVVGPLIGGLIVQSWGYPPLMYGAAGLCLSGAATFALPSGDAAVTDNSDKAENK